MGNKINLKLQILFKAKEKSFAIFLTKIFFGSRIILNRIVLNRTKGGLMHFWDQHKNITLYYEALTKSICDKYDLKQLEYDILMFLHFYPQFNTAADIVKVRKSTKSHVSTSLKVLEQKGLIEKKQNAKDKKCIEIYLLKKSDEIIEDGIDIQKKFMWDLFQGISEDEMKIFKDVFDQICKNADNFLKESDIEKNV